MPALALAVWVARRGSGDLGRRCRRPWAGAVSGAAPDSEHSHGPIQLGYGRSHRGSPHPPPKTMVCAVCGLLQQLCGATAPIHIKVAGRGLTAGASSAALFPLPRSCVQAAYMPSACAPRSRPQFQSLVMCRRTRRGPRRVATGEPCARNPMRACRLLHRPCAVLWSSPSWCGTGAVYADREGGATRAVKHRGWLTAACALLRPCCRGLHMRHQI